MVYVDQSTQINLNVQLYQSSCSGPLESINIKDADGKKTLFMFYFDKIVHFILVFSVAQIIPGVMFTADLSSPVSADINILCQDKNKQMCPFKLPPCSTAELL